MKNQTHAALLGALMLTAMVHGAPPAAEDFSHEAAFNLPVLSPDGQALAYSETIKGEHRTYVMDLNTKRKFGLELLGRDRSFSHNTYHFWANDKRFVYLVPRTGTYSAINRDGSSPRTNIRGGELVFAFHDKQGRLLMTGRELVRGNKDEVGTDAQFFYGNRMFVHEVDPSAAAPVQISMESESAWAEYRKVAENPGNVTDWVATTDGEVLAGAEIRGTRYRTLHRQTIKDEWSAPPGLDWKDPQSAPLAYSTDGGTLYVTRVTPEGTWGVYPYNLTSHQLGEPILAHKKYDIIHPGYRPRENGIDLTALILSPKEHALLGIRYQTDYPRVLWLDSGLGEVQAALDQALPNRVNSITSMSDDLQRLIVLSWSSQDSGSYFLFDRKQQKLEKLFSRRPWLKAESMAETLAVRFKTRDGVALGAYLTIPAGRERKNLPLLVVPHGFTKGRSTWGFDPYGQFLASRGYAVLVVDMRGSVGYGEAVREAAVKRQMELAVADCADGARWAIAQKLADPGRIAVAGMGNLSGSYALMSLARESDLYRCGIDLEGITDWVRSAAKFKVIPDYLVAWREKFGNPAIPEEASVLAANSPINNAPAIKKPVLIIHDREDSEWFFNQSKQMADAIKQAGGQVELSTKYDEKYGYQTVAKYMTDMLAFLQKHMPAE